MRNREHVAPPLAYCTDLHPTMMKFSTRTTKQRSTHVPLDQVSPRLAACYNNQFIVEVSINIKYHGGMV